MLRTRTIEPILAVPILALALVGCDAYKASLLRAPGSARAKDAGLRMEGGPIGDAAMDAGRRRDGALPDACMPALEACNRVDDDCDGKTDEDTQAACESVVLNAETDCVPFGKTAASCLLLQCRPGFEDCDGNPANGCEPYCTCHDCADAGDGGSEIDAGR